MSKLHWQKLSFHALYCDLKKCHAFESSMKWEFCCCCSFWSCRLSFKSFYRDQSCQQQSEGGDQQCRANMTSSITHAFIWFIIYIGSDSLWVSQEEALTMRPQCQSSAEDWHRVYEGCWCGGGGRGSGRVTSCSAPQVVISAPWVGEVRCSASSFSVWHISDIMHCQITLNKSDTTFSIFRLAVAHKPGPPSHHQSRDAATATAQAQALLHLSVLSEYEAALRW